MAWGSVPTAKGQLTYFKGRLRKFSKGLVQGTDFKYTEERRVDGESEEVERHRTSPNGLTATLKNGAKVFAYLIEDSFRRTVRFAATNLDGVTKAKFYSASDAIAFALDSGREYLVGPASKVTITLRHDHQENKLKLGVSVQSPLPEEDGWYIVDSSRVWTHYMVGNDSGLNTQTINTSNQSLIDLAVGLMAEQGRGDVLPLLDAIQEEKPGVIDKACGTLMADMPPKDKLVKIVYDWTASYSKNRSRLVHMNTDEPVEGERGQWSEWSE